MAELLDPISFEKEKYTEDDYDQMLYDSYGDTVSICGMDMNPVQILKEFDETAYRCGFNDYQEYEKVYVCPICGEEFDDEDDAKFCCQAEDEEDEEE